MLAKYLRTTLTCAACILLTACNFEDKNTNPNESTFIKPGPLLTYTQLNTSIDGHTKNMQIGCCMMMVQQTASLESTEAGVGDKYYMMQAPATSYFLDSIVQLSRTGAKWNIRLPKSQNTRICLP